MMTDVANTNQADQKGELISNSSDDRAETKPNNINNPIEYSPHNDPNEPNEPNELNDSNDSNGTNDSDWAYLTKKSKHPFNEATLKKLSNIKINSSSQFGSYLSG